MKIPFDIKFRPQIESRKYKVVTRDDKPARIICWDAKGDLPIVALVEQKHCEIVVKSRINDSFLFIITPNDELTEFEKEFDSAFRSYFREECEGGYLAWVKARSAKLLQLARKEIVKED